MDKRLNMICEDPARRERVRGHATLNGIDYIEVPRESQLKIRVFFIKPGEDDIPELKTSKVRVEGGVRIRDIRVTGLRKVGGATPYLEVSVDKAGDFSTYTLVIDDDASVDSAFSRRPFSFKAGCPSDIDCRDSLECPTEPKKEPLIDYLAKDYSSFRRALVDLVPTIAPYWTERHEADLGVAMVDLLAYVGDRLSYYQDSVANEAYLETARQRVSVRRHARLIDYRMHEGSNARAFVHVTVGDGTPGTIPASTRVLSRIDVPLGPKLMPPHGPEIEHEAKARAIASADVVFETVEEQRVRGELNEIEIYTWGNKRCCVPKGATTLDLVGDLAGKLNVSDFLLLEEDLGPLSGDKADADPAHRQVVRLTEVKKIRDKLVGKDLTRVAWHRGDALRFPLCVSSRRDDGSVIDNVSVARGNMLLVDHGYTVEDEDGKRGEWHPADPDGGAAVASHDGQRCVSRRGQSRNAELC